jgi:flavin-dependent dehydrogenase
MNYDVCVLGGGPAGSVIAKKLCELGYAVLIVHREQAMPVDLCLSLTPGIDHWLELLDVKEQVMAEKFQRFSSNWILWENRNPVQKEQAGEKTGYYVNKSRFDRILLQAAADAGVKLVKPANAVFVSRNDSKGWNIKLVDGTVRTTVSASFLVEATGRKPVLKSTKKNWWPVTLATYAYWNSPLESKGFSFVEAGVNHWYWGSHIGKTGFACVFSDPAEIRNFSSVNAFYYSKLKGSYFLSPFLNGRIKTAISICAATPYFDILPVSQDHIKVGDAAFTTDVLSSQGVQLAIKTAFQGAFVVNTLLLNKNPALAIDFFNNLVKDSVNRNLTWTKAFYNKQQIYVDGSFWRQRQQHVAKPENAPLIGSKVIDPFCHFVINNELPVREVPVLGNKIIESANGFVFSDREEPLVFIEGISAVSMVKLINGTDLQGAIQKVSALLPATDPIKVLRWLVYKKVLLVNSL